MSTGPGGPPRPASARQAKVTAGLAHRGDLEPVIVLIIQSPEHSSPVTVEISEQQARLLRTQLAVVIVEKPPAA
jgi:hypothetical protein